MDIITKTGEIWSENAIGAVISLIKESDDSIWVLQKRITGSTAIA